LLYAYLDESGSTAPSRPHDRFLIVAVLIASDHAARRIRRHVRGLNRRAHVRGSGELEAADAAPRQRQWLYERLRRERFTIVAVVLDKGQVYRAPDDPEDWYRAAVAYAARCCWEYWPRFELVLDKRYGNPNLRRRLDQAIESRLAETGCTLHIEHRESAQDLMLQAVDYVAWAIHARYERGEIEGYALIGEKILREDLLGPT